MKAPLNLKDFSVLYPQSLLVRIKKTAIQILIMLCYTAARSLSAQELPRVRNFSPDDYNAQPQNWSIDQENQEAWMYFGNNSGLLEYDGARWQLFSLPEKQTLRAVACSNAGKIYTGGFAEFGYWEKNAAGTLDYYSLSKDVQAVHLPKEEIWHILALPHEVLFQSFSTIYKYKDNKITVLNPPSAIMFVHNLDGRILLQVIGRGIFELLPDDSFRLLEGTEILGERIVQFIISDGKGGFWAGTTNDGIWAYSNGIMRPWSASLNSTFKRYQLNKAIRLRNGGTAIGTILNGVYLLNPDGSLRAHLNREAGLQNNTVLALHEDRDQNLWIGLDRGNDFVELNSPLTFFNDQTGKIGAVYTAAWFQDRLYLGTNQGVYIKGKQGTNDDFHLIEGTQGQVWQLQIFDNQLLCGHNAGTFLLNGPSAQKISSITGGWHTLQVPGQPDALIQGTYTGLIVFRKKGNAWEVSHRITGFNEPLRKIAFDAQGYLWGAHPNRGLFRLRLSNDLKQILEQKSFSTADGLPSEFKVDLVSLDTALIVNPEGAPRKISFNGTAVRFDTLAPYLQSGKILPGMGHEFFMVDKSAVRLCVGKQADWFPVSLVYGYENIVPLTAHEYLFCQENGYALLDKSKIPQGGYAYSVQPFIRQVEAGGEAVDIVNQTNSIQIPYRRNALKFSFGAPVFGHQPKYSWRLDGFGKNWSEWQSSPEKEFTNLPPGAYIFRVRTNVSDAEVAFSFRILPPWYQSLWAMTCYALIALLLLYLLERYNQRRLARQRAQLEDEKQQDLTRQRTDAEREMLSLELDNKSRELSNAALGLIRKNEILLKIKDDLLASKGETRALDRLARLIDSHVESDHDWEIFEASFNQVHDDFFKRLMSDFPDLTPGDLRLAAYLKMNLASKEIAPLLNISVRGVENKRYRLRKKIGLPEDANLTEFMMNY
jgi:DNA-binding CsgD family transcriptional regulator